MPSAAWLSRVDDIRPPKSDLNALILDYLTNEGYPAAAERFSKEARLPLPEDAPSIQARKDIQQAIHTGSIQSAIEAINELNNQVLDGNPALHFALLRLQLVELIRTCNSTPDGDITPALHFAQTQLAPRAPTRPEFLEDLERTMAILLFGPDDLAPQLAKILHPDLRREVADQVNRAILESQSQRTEASIRNMVRLRAWAENTARDQKKQDMPSHIDLGLDVEATAENGHDVMID